LNTADDIFKMIQPFIGALIGGGVTLAATQITFRNTNKSTIATERRKLSHDSAREITSQLAVAAGIARRHRERDSLDLTPEGQNELADCVTAMEHHARFLSDSVLQASVDEAVDFLRPPPEFELHLGRSVQGIIYDLQRWLVPMVQSHILGDAMPDEPAFLKNYRDTYAIAEEVWDDFVKWEERKRTEEREARKAQRTAETDAQESTRNA
jgi:hypothetical protein